MSSTSAQSVLQVQLGRQLQLPPPLLSTAIGRTHEIPSNLPISRELDSQEFLLACEVLYLREGKGRLRRREFCGVREGKLLVLGKLARVGDGVYASEKKEAIVAEEESLLFLAKHRIGDFLALQDLRVGTFPHGLDDLAGRQRRKAGLHSPRLFITLLLHLESLPRMK